MPRTQGEAESLYAYLRLATSLCLMTIGGVGMYAMAVALPLIQAEFAVGRSEASLPYTLTMIGFGLGGILRGRMSDRYGVMLPVLIGAEAGRANSAWRMAFSSACSAARRPLLRW